MVLLFSGYLMNKIACASQNTEVKSFPVDVCVFGHFGWLSPAAVHSANCRFDSGVKWWIYVSSIVTYLRKKSFFGALKQLQIMHSIVDALLFFMNFPIDKCSCKMLITQPSDILSSSAISRNFNLRSVKTSSWSFLVFSGTTAEFGWPEHSASFVSIFTNHSARAGYDTGSIFKRNLTGLNSEFSFS